MRHKAVAAVAIVLLFLAVSLYAQEKTYVGADKCKLCHKIEYTSWAATKHAKAFDSLKPEDRAKKECVECHVTGGKTEMPGVQCEACHGPGSQYKTISIMKDKQKAIAAGLVIPTEKNCVQCHNKKSPTFKGFNFAEMAPKVHDKKKA
jgi:DnaJ-class molecular chaperone